MKIGIIGAGNIGGILARKLSAAGNDVRIANTKGLEGVRRFAQEINAKPADVIGAVNGVDVVILAIPLPAVQQLPSNLFDSLPQNSVVIDTSNYYPGMRDHRIPELDDGLAESMWVSQQIGRPVVKAFNNALAYTLAELGQPEDTLGRLAIAVSGNDGEAKKIAMDLVRQTGFDPVDAGLLEESWRHQPSTPAYCCDLDADAMRKALAGAISGAASKKRDQLPEFFASLGASPTHDDIVAMNRRLNVVP